MLKRHLVALSGVLVLALVLCALPAVAQIEGGGRAAPPPVATATVGGSQLAVQPLVPFDRAALRVSGPEGYAAQRVFGDSQEPIAIDLVADRRAATDANPFLPKSAAELGLVDGIYRYEAVFVGGDDRRLHTGVFFVEAGSAITREQKRAQLAGLRQSLEGTRQRGAEQTANKPVPNYIVEYDYIYLDDFAADGTTAVIMDSDGGGVPLSYYWGIENDYDSLRLGRTFSDRGQLTYPYMTINNGVRSGFGTTTPNDYLEVVGTSTLSRITASTLSGNNVTLAVAPGMPGTGVWGIVTGFSNPVYGFSNAFSRLLDIGPYAAITLNGDVAISSSRKIKTDFTKVDPAEVLGKITELPIQSWRLTDDPRNARHIGPFAEDFHEAFGLGVDNEHISPIDASGVALVAIQELARKVEALAEENRLLREEVARLQKPVSRPPEAAGISHW